MRGNISLGWIRFRRAVIPISREGGDIPDQRTYLRRGILAVGIRADHGATDLSNTL